MTFRGTFLITATFSNLHSALFCPMVSKAAGVLTLATISYGPNEILIMRVAPSALNVRADGPCNWLLGIPSDAWEPIAAHSLFVL